MLQNMEQELVSRVGKDGWSMKAAMEAVDDVTQLHTLLLKDTIVKKIGKEGEAFTESLYEERLYLEVVTACSLEALGPGEAGPKTPLAPTIREDINTLISGWRGKLEGSGKPSDVKSYYGSLLTDLQTEFDQSTDATSMSVAIRLISVEKEVKHGFNGLDKKG